MQGGPDQHRRPPEAPTAAQLESLHRIRGCVAAAGPPPSDLDGQRALSELLAKQGYRGESATLAPLDVHLLSLPPEGHVPKGLPALLGRHGSNFVEGLNKKILPKEEAKEKVRTCGVRRPYLDGGIRDPRRYRQLVGALQARGLIRFRRQVRCTVGIFAVWKKSGLQRLIIDARWSNCWFSDAGEVNLATGAAFSTIEVDEGEPIYLGQVDLADAFYHMALPHELQDLRVATAHRLDAALLQ